MVPLQRLCILWLRVLLYTGACRKDHPRTICKTTTYFSRWLRTSMFSQYLWSLLDNLCPQLLPADLCAATCQKFGYTASTVLPRPSLRVTSTFLFERTAMLSPRIHRCLPSEPSRLLESIFPHTFPNTR